MTRIDRYLLFLYFRVLFICFASITGLLIVVQVFSNLDEFLQYAKARNTGVVDVLIDYYGPYTLTIFEKLSGLIALLALLFVIAWLYRTNEFTALMAAGVTKRRVVRPLLIASAVVVLSAVVLREVSIPQYQDKLDRNPQDLTGAVGRPAKPRFDSRAQVLITGRFILAAKQQIVEPWFNVQKGPLSASCGRQLAAKLATYHAGDDGKPAGYLLSDVKYPAKVDLIASVHSLDGTPLFLTSKEASWLKPGECFLASEIEFEKLRGGNSWKQFASTAELVSHLRSGELRNPNDLRIQVHQRLLRPFADWTLLLLGIPVLLTRPDRHMFWVAGACLLLVSGFSGIVFGLSALASSGYLISPAVAVWLPMLIFLPWGWVRTAQSMES